MYEHLHVILYRRAPFLSATNSVNGLKKEVRENYFHESTLGSSLQSAILVTIEFLLIFSEMNFVKLFTNASEMLQ